MLDRFNWLTEADYWHFEELIGDNDFYIEAIYDDDGDFVDIGYFRGSYHTTLNTEPGFWAWENLETGNYVAEAA